MSLIPCSHPHHNPCVQLCCEARNAAIKYNRSGESPFPDDYLSTEDQCEFFLRSHEMLRHMEDPDPDHAYRAHMPPLINREAIQDFISCVLHGMVIGAIEQDAGTKLLYSAQIALTALPGPAKETRTHTPTPLLDTSRFR